MVGLRRFGPLLGVLALAVAMLLARLWDVQVREHGIWAREAANLQRSWTVVPYMRGALLDRQGRTWVRDEEVYELELVWRDFRRGHLLGQVAQLRSLVELRSVPLVEMRKELDRWTRAFARLSPAEIDAFGRGHALELGEVRIPAVSQGSSRERRRRARLARRGSRAAELHWYVQALFSSTRGERKAIGDLEDSASWSRPYVALFAAERRVTTMSLQRQLAGRVATSLERLAELAAEIDWGVFEHAAPGGFPADPAGRLLALLEAKRREVEFAAADDLFEEAAGFPASRLDAANLERIDLEWLRRALYWDGGRLGEWMNDRGSAWPRAVRRHLAGHAIARSKVEAGHADPADGVLSALAWFFNGDRRDRPGSARPIPWWRVAELVVLKDFERRFTGAKTLPESLFDEVLPFERALLLEAQAQGQESGALLERALISTPHLEPDAASAAQRMAEIAAASRRSWDPQDEAPFAAALIHWDTLLQARLAALLDALPLPVELRAGWVDAALERRGYVVRDRESRPLRFDRAPSYQLVHLVTRYPDHYAGFHVRCSTRRVPVTLLDGDPEDPRLLAEALIGRVRVPYLVDLFAQRPIEAALRERQTQLEIDEEDRRWILDTVAATWSDEATMGGSGLEGYLDEELRGRNGYREGTGLTERARSDHQPTHLAAIDGLEVVLTLDADLQRAALEVICAPEPPPAEELAPDRVWHDRSVGAIVLMTVDGELLAAASAPARPEPAGLYQDGQRELDPSIDRTLRMPLFHPPGSLLKPFVAAWGLEQGWITPETPFSCTTNASDPSKFGSHREGAVVHCLKLWGHGVGDVTLDRALRKSCNAYFAALGECYGAADFREMAHAFGFDRATGVRCLEGRRGGLVENWSAGPFFRRQSTVATSSMLQRLGNGLSHINSTPVQVARAYAGLATGELPSARLVRSIGDQPVVATKERVPVAEAHLEAVRRSLRSVPIDGTAQNKGLDRKSLGLSLACKTGSADTRKGAVPVDPNAPISTSPHAWEEGKRNHGWLAGWFPADEPRAVVVVYCHDVTTTASHIATHVARQFLERPEVQRWAEEGMR